MPEYFFLIMILNDVFPVTICMILKRIVTTPADNSSGIGMGDLRTDDRHLPVIMNVK